MFSGSSDWLFKLSGTTYELIYKGKPFRGVITQLDTVNIHYGLIWAKISFTDINSRKITLGGITNTQARTLHSEISRLLRKVHLKKLISEFDKELDEVIAWLRSVKKNCKEQLAHRGWLSHEFRVSQNKLKPRLLESLLNEPDLASYLSKKPTSIKKMSLSGERISLPLLKELTRNTYKQSWKIMQSSLKQ